MTGALKIIARDAEDLTVVSACLQDALVPLTETRYLPQERRFIMVVNRFRWERAAVAQAGAMADAQAREASLITFLAAAANISLLGIGGAFWGLVIGLVAHAVLNGRLPQRAPRQVMAPAPANKGVS